VRKAQTEATHRHSLVIEALNGLETIKCARAEGQFQQQWEQFVGHNSRTAEEMRSWSTLAMNATGFIQQLVSVGVIIIGVYLFSEGDVSSGAIIAAVILSSRAVAPLGQIASTLSRAQQAFHAYKALDRIMALPAEEEGQDRHMNRRIAEGRINFDDLTFAYPESDAPALKDFNLKIEPGERVGIIGKIGSGKTTIGRLLARLYLPTSGMLLIDDVDIRQYHPAEVRRAVAFISQDTALFFGTLRDNIVLGVPHISDDLVLRAAEFAGVADFAKNHPKGFNMQVGEGGRFLSSGQRQAVVLARAFLLEPLIMFLDEPSGAMDMASERLLIQRLKTAFRPDQTVIVTTHLRPRLREAVSIGPSRPRRARPRASGAAACRGTPAPPRPTSRRRAPSRRPRGSWPTAPAASARQRSPRARACRERPQPAASSVCGKDR